MISDLYFIEMYFIKTVYCWRNVYILLFKFYNFLFIICNRKISLKNQHLSILLQIPSRRIGKWTSILKPLHCGNGKAFNKAVEFCFHFNRYSDILWALNNLYVYIGTCAIKIKTLNNKKVRCVYVKYIKVVCLTMYCQRCCLTLLAYVQQRIVGDTDIYSLVCFGDVSQVQSAWSLPLTPSSILSLVVIFCVQQRNIMKLVTDTERFPVLATKHQISLRICRGRFVEFVLWIILIL